MAKQRWERIFDGKTDSYHFFFDHFGLPSFSSFQIILDSCHFFLDHFRQLSFFLDHFGQLSIFLDLDHFLLMGHRWAIIFFGGVNNLLVEEQLTKILNNNHVINPNNLLIFPGRLCNLDVFVGTSLPLICPLIAFMGSLVRYVIDKLKSPCRRQGIITCLAGRGPSAKGEHWLR